MQGVIYCETDREARKVCDYLDGIMNEYGIGLNTIKIAYRQEDIYISPYDVIFLNKRGLQEAARKYHKRIVWDELAYMRL